MSGKLSFHDWKSQGILLQKTCRNPGLNRCNFVHPSVTHVDQPKMVQARITKSSPSAA